MVIFGLPFTIPEALPGGTWTLGVEAGYRLKQTDRSLTEAFGIVQHRGVWLSDEARALAPTATSRDFALSQVEAGVSHRWKPGDRPLVLGVTGSLGQYWFGGDALSRVLRLSGQAVWSQSEDQIWSAGLSTEKSWNIIRSDRDSDTMQLSLGWQRGLGAKGSFSAMAGLRNVASPAADIDHEAGFLRLGYAQAANPEGLEAALSLGIEARSYTLVPAFPTEIKLDAEASLTFNQLDYMGFSPRLTVNAERNRSDFLPRDTRDVSVGLGISSQF